VNKKSGKAYKIAEIMDNLNDQGQRKRKVARTGVSTENRVFISTGNLLNKSVIFAFDQRLVHISSSSASIVGDVV